jgi:hypothetical protein
VELSGLNEFGVTGMSSIVIISMSLSESKEEDEDEGDPIFDFATLGHYGVAVARCRAEAKAVPVSTSYVSAFRIA